jgi:uncharacterized DUF497 family protein
MELECEWDLSKAASNLTKHSVLSTKQAMRRCAR